MKQVKRVRTWNWSLEWKPQSSDQVWSYFMKVKAELRVVSVSSLVTLYCKCNALRTLCTTICWNLWFLYNIYEFFFSSPMSSFTFIMGAMRGNHTVCTCTFRVLRSFARLLRMTTGRSLEEASCQPTVNHWTGNERDWRFKLTKSKR